MSEEGWELARECILAAQRPSEFLAAWLEHSAILSPKARTTFEHYYGNFGSLSSERLRWSYDRQLQEVTELVSCQVGVKVLEIGAGCGTESLWFAFKGAYVKSIDIRADRLAVARERQSILETFLERELQCRFEQQSLLEITDAELFDVIWIQQTFHHLEPRAHCVDAIARLVRPGGAVVLSEVNALNPLLQLLLLRRRGFKTIIQLESEGGQLIPYGNERILTASSLKRWLQKAGLSESTVSYYRILPSDPRFDRLAKLERMISGSPLIPLHTHYNLVARKPV